MLFLDVDRQKFVRFHLDAVDFLEKDARTGDGQFEAFAAHVLEKNREMKFTATGDFPDGFVVGVTHAHGDVGLELAFETFANLAGRHELAFTAGERRGVNLEVHRQGRLIDLEHREGFVASGEKTAVQRYDTDYRSGNVAVLTTDNILKVYDGTTGALLTDVEAAPVEEAQYISVTALPDGYALLQYNDENYDILAIQTYGGEGLLWSSAGEAQQYTYASYLTNTANGPLLTAHRDNSDSSNLSDVLDMEGNLLLRRLGSCYIPDDLPDDCFIARQGFDYGLMDSTGQWLYRESIFSSPSDDAGGGYLY